MLELLGDGGFCAQRETEYIGVWQIAFSYQRALFLSGEK